MYVLGTRYCTHVSNSALCPLPFGLVLVLLLLALTDLIPMADAAAADILDARRVSTDLLLLLVPFVFPPFASHQPVSYLPFAS